MLTLNVLAFIACLYIARAQLARVDGKPMIVDALACNWLFCQTVTTANSGYGIPEAFLAIDLVTGVFLVAYVQGREARNVASIFVPMFFVNGFRYLFGSEETRFLDLTIDVLAWFQLFVAYIGGANGALATLDFAFRRRRGLFADAIDLLQGRK